MSKIREWLIHKLGGYTKDETTLPLPPDLKIYRDNSKVKRIESVRILESQLPIYLMEEIRNDLTTGLAQEIRKQRFKVKEEKIGTNWVYSMELEYLEQGVEEE